MYIGSHYNSYYNQVYGQNNSSVYKPYQPTGTYNADQQNPFTSSGSAAVGQVTDLKDSAKALDQALNALSHNAINNSSKAVSSNQEIAEVDGGKNTYFSDKTLQVEQLAQKQINTGSELATDKQANLSGQQQFAITDAAGNSQEFSFYAHGGETNQQILSKMADTINAADSAYTATLSVNSLSNTSNISISNNQTGEQSAFSLSDISGDAVALSGANQVNQQAQDAIYQLNGQTNTSADNSINLGNGIEATLMQASDQQVTISRGLDTDLAKQQMADFAEAYNQLYGTALEHSDDSKTYELFQQIIGNSQNYLSTLAPLGVEFDQEAKMSINEDKLNQAAEDGSLTAFLEQNTSANYGYLSQLGRIADDVQNNTQKYISQEAFAFNADNFYSQSSQQIYNNLFNPWQSTNSSYGSAGWLFDIML